MTGTSSMSHRERAIADEQVFVDHAYMLLDRQREDYRGRLAQIRVQGGQESAGELSERDSFAAHYEDGLARLRYVENRLVLGRIDDVDAVSRHIGRIGLAEDNQEIALLDWRAPQAVPFYQATAAEPQGVVLRRHIATRLREVTGVEDELLDSSGELSEVNITGEGALMAALGQARDGKMGDIVATIQGEQDRVIRAPSRGVLVVQGGPGTGKTAVALHRAAYLLYAERERLARSGVLVIGPSERFLSYIDQVLPSLGESDVVSTTMARLVPGVEASGVDTPEVAEIKGRAVWRRLCRRAVSRVLERSLDTPVVVRVDSYRLRLLPEDVAQAQKLARESGKPHNLARDIYASFLVEKLACQLAQAVKKPREGNDWLIKDVASSVEARREINLRWLPSSPLQLLERLWARPSLLAQVAPELSERERSLLYRAKGEALTVGDIALIDELAEALGPYVSPTQQALEAVRAREKEDFDSYIDETMKTMNLGGGIVSARDFAERHSRHHNRASLAERASEDRRWTYGHIVVDEAQELSPMQWEMLIRRCPSRSMTIVGDVDQRPSGATPGGWAELMGRVGDSMEVRSLTVSYRTPATIMRTAQRALHTAGFPVAPMMSARDVEDAVGVYENADIVGDVCEYVRRELAFLDSVNGDGQGLLAVIVPVSLLDCVRTQIAADDFLASLTVSQGARLARLSLLSATQAKGLEYDSVLVCEPSDILAEGPGNLYVAMTRSTRRLALASSEVLPSGFVE